MLRYFGRQGGFTHRKWRDDLIAPDKIYKKYRQTPLKEFYEKLCAKYYTNEQRRIGLSKQAALKRKMNGVFKKFLDFLARRERNLLIYIFAEGGEGKSRLAVAVYHLFALALKQYHPDWKLELKYADSIDKTQQFINEITNGDTILQDEDPDVTGIGSKNLLKKLNTLLKELRKTQKNVIFCSPSMHIYQNVFIALELFGINEDKFFTRALVWYFDRQATEIKAYPLGYLEVDVGKIQAEFDQYVTNFKDPHLQNIQGTGGSVVASSNVKKWEALAPAFAKCAKAHGWNGSSKKALIETYIGYFIDECRESGHPIAPDANDVKQMAELTFNYATEQAENTKKDAQEEKEAEMADMPDKFEVNEISLVNAMQKEPYPDWKTKEDDITMYLMNKDEGLSYSKIATRMKKSTQTVSNGIHRVILRLDHKIGRGFEKYVKQLVDELDQYEPAICDGSPKMPDVWAVNKKKMTALVVSCKCPSYEATSKSVPAKEQGPEVRKARALRAEGYAVTCTCRLLNRTSGHLWEKPINIDKPKCLTFPY